MKPSAVSYQQSGKRSGGFTLVELLTVIAIIGILAAIIIPTTSGVRNSAKRAETKVRFSQWALAMEQFRQEYGYFPQIDNGTGRIVPSYLLGALTAHDLNGNAITSTGDATLCGNKKLISFYSISESELNETHSAIVDSFGNSVIGVIYDKDGDGRITGSDGNLVAFQFTDGSAGPTTTDVDLSTGVRAGVIFYSAGRGNSASDIIYSWK